MTDEPRRALLPPVGWIMLAAALALSGLGLAGIYAGEADAPAGPVLTLRQVASLAAALIGFVLVYSIGCQRLGPGAYVWYGLAVAALAALVAARWLPLAPLIKPRRNAFRWIDLGVTAFQVSEAAKLAFILALAWFLRFRTDQRRVRGLLVPVLLTAVPAGLILLEPDLGTAMLLLPTLAAVLFAAGMRVFHAAVGLAVGAVAAPLFYFSPLMSEYQRQRVRAVVRQNETDPAWHNAAGYQLRQSKIAIGSGGPLGRGFLEGGFFRHNLLPEEHNDFIFAVIAHQWGLAGSLGVLVCYGLVLLTCLMIAGSTHDPFGRLVCVGVSALIGTQAFVNIAMTIGLLPITGLTLPFVSFGGSGLAANYATLALVSSVAARRRISLAPRAFEFPDEDEPAG